MAPIKIVFYLYNVPRASFIISIKISTIQSVG